MAKVKEIISTKHLPHTAVINGDGSAIQQQHIGSGVHGYIFQNDKIGKKDGNRPNKYIITSIGYLEVELLLKYQGQYEPVIPEAYIDGYFSYGILSTNNVAELKAFIETAYKIIEMKQDEDSYNITKLIFQTDSMYLINVANAVVRDDRWKSEDKINKDCWLEIDGIIQTLNTLGVEYQIDKVKGHSTNLGNNIADRMAFLGRMESTRLNVDKVFKISPAKNYWTKVPDRHPFLAFKQLFFTNTARQENSETLYAMMKYRKKDDDLGKKSHEACFGLVLLQESEPLIENAINVYQKHMKSLSLLSSLDLGNLYDNSSIRYIDLFGNKPFMFNKNINTLNILEEKDVVFEVKPAGLATQAMERVLGLYMVIKEYRNNVNSRFKFEDVTELFYKPDAKGNNAIQIPNGINDIVIKTTFEEHDLVIPVTLGRDTLERNTFKKMEKDDVKVTLVLEKITPTFLSYYLILDMKSTGDISIWHNFYSNNILFAKPEPKKK